VIKVYVAGAYTAPTVVQVLENMRRGIDAAVQVAKLGMAPYCPWLDFQYGLVSAMPVEVYKEISMEWLRASDAVLVVPGWENSEGTKAEIQEAVNRDIPVFFSLRSLVRWTMGQIDDYVNDELAKVIENWYVEERIKWIGAPAPGSKTRMGVCS